MSKIAPSAALSAKQVDLILTRPFNFSIAIAEEIKKFDRRIKPIISPLLQIVETASSLKAEGLDQENHWINSPVAILFISPTAIEVFFRNINKSKFNPDRLYFVVGEKSSLKLRSHLRPHLKDQRIVLSQQEEMASLLNSPALRSLKKILVVQGNKNNKLIDSLSCLMDVLSLSIYRRQPQDLTAEALSSLRSSRRWRKTAVLISSTYCLRRFQEQLSSTGASSESILLLTHHPKIAQALRSSFPSAQISICPLQSREINLAIQQLL